MENENKTFEVVDRASMEHKFNNLQKVELTVPSFRKREQITSNNFEYIEMFQNKLKQLKGK